MSSVLLRGWKKIAAKSVAAVGSVAVAIPAASAEGAPGSAGYANGFYIHDSAGNYSLQVDGLLQPRFNHFSTDGTAKLGATDQSSNNFDLFLGRLYFSGNLFDPTLTYFVTLQGSTTGNGSGITILDAVIAKSFSPYLKVEGGRYWSAYTYEYNTDIAQYLFPDLSAAEWAFSLGRQTGFRISGKAASLTYRLSVSNSIPGSDVGNTENLHSKLATILNVQYDVLEPYAPQESSPDPAGAPRPQLSLWASMMYNPVEYATVFQNDRSGDVTHGATASVNFRYGYFTFQGSGYYKKNDARAGVHDGFNSHGLQEQAGYYLIPGKLEIAERVDGIRWGLGQIPATGGAQTQWYAGPANFSYRDLLESTLGLNYYLHGHGAKMQLQYSHLTGKGFGDERFHANRVILQAQLAF
jgi:phosphate-selective porin OprO/OprP